MTNRNPEARLFCMAVLAAVVTLQGARSQDSTHTMEAIPVIQMDSVPLNDAIRTLARQTGQNFILDSRIYGPWVGPDGTSGREPSVTFRWENLTAEQALGRLLKEHGLTVVANPATSIARIAFTNQAVKPLPASAIGDGTNAVIPLVCMDSVSLAAAIRTLAAQAHLHLDLDPSLAVPACGPLSRSVSECDVSVRWENVTARQALAALLDSYDLVLVQDSANSSARIMPKAQTESGRPQKDR
jgi:hypothetical protein